MTGPSLALAALLLAAGGDVVARVEGTAITRSQVVTRLGAGQAAQGRPLRPEEALEGIVLDTLLAREGERAGLGGSKKVAEYVETATARAAADAFVADMAERSPPDEKTLSEMFHATADSVAFESVVFGTQAEAAAALSRVKAGASLAEVAKSAVVSRLYEKPETAPTLMRGEIPPRLAPALFAGAPGRAVGPIDDGIGWTIAVVLKKEVGSDSSFAARRPALVASALNQVKGALRKHLGQQLRAKAGVTLDEDFLRGLNGLDASPAQLAHEIARVNGRPLRYAEVHAGLAALAMGGRMTGPAVKIQLAWAEIDRRLLEGAAVERGYAKAAAVQARQGEFRQLALGAAAVAQIQGSAPPPTEEEITAHYRRNAARYGKPFQQVLPVVVAEAAAEKRATYLAERVRELRKRAAVTVDREALANVGSAAR